MKNHNRHMPGHKSCESCFDVQLKRGFNGINQKKKSESLQILLTAMSYVLLTLMFDLGDKKNSVLPWTRLIFLKFATDTQLVDA